MQTTFTSELLTNHFVTLSQFFWAEKANEDPPAKLLDDLFRKTKAAPCIYWLPLTDEQVRHKLVHRLRLLLLVHIHEG